MLDEFPVVLFRFHNLEAMHAEQGAVSSRRRTKVAVVGGSLSGLALARALQHVPSELVEVSVTVLEAQSDKG